MSQRANEDWWSWRVSARLWPWDAASRGGWAGDIVGDASPALALSGIDDRTGDGDDDGVLGASSCSAGGREEKSAISSSPEPSRAGPRLASPYYHVGWYREGIPVQQSGGGLALGTDGISERRPDGKSDVWWGTSTGTPQANEVTRHQIIRAFQGEHDGCE
jgi:hypothetical protein